MAAPVNRLCACLPYVEGTVDVVRSRYDEIRNWAALEVIGGCKRSDIYQDRRRRCVIVTKELVNQLASSAGHVFRKVCLQPRRILFWLRGWTYRRRVSRIAEKMRLAVPVVCGNSGT